MSLPVSQYEALLAEVRGLRRKAQRVQQLATPLLSTSTSTNSYINEHSLNNVATNAASCLNYTMDSAPFHHSSDRDHEGTSSGPHVLESDLICSEDEGGGALSAQMSVSSEPISHENRAMSMLYHGTWPVERTMWNSEPINLVPTSSSCNRTDMNSVMSFASSSGGAPLDRVLSSPDRSRRSSQQLEAKVDMVYSLLSMLGGQEHADTGETLLALSTNPESCLAMRQSGCIPLLVQLVQSDKNCETQKKAAQALHNLVHSNPDEKLKKRETRVLKLLEEIRAYSGFLLKKTGSELLVKTEDGDSHPVQAIANLMKYSFDEGNRQAICQLGGIHTIANLVENEHSVHGSLSNEENCILLRRYSCMALTNLTFGDGGNKALLCLCKDFMVALVVQLQSPCDELRQVTASVLRNLSWRADATSKDILKKVGAVTGLMKAAMINNKENTLKSVLSALWNLSAHCTENKSEICLVEDALSFLVKMLSYKSPSKSLTIIENAGGVLRNISSQIAIRDDYRQILRDQNCLQILLDQLKSPSLTVVSNACGTLWNLSAKNRIDQDLLWQLGAPAMLRSLNHSKHKMIAMGSSAALKNLLASRQSHNLVPQLDATAKAMDLPTLPTLSARKQKAIIQELEQNLSETFDNIEKDSSPFKTYPNENFSLKSTDKLCAGTSNSFLNKSLRKHSDHHERRASHENNSFSSIDDVNTAFTNLSIVEPLGNYQTKPQPSRSYGASSLPYVKSPVSYLSNSSYDGEESDLPEEPIDYSRKYTETKPVSNFKTTSPSESFGIYTETDLDQPTDYSLRYAEDDSENEEICKKIEKPDFVQDTIKTYCTEDTPYETPFNYSTATSMSDLRETGLEAEKEVIDNDQLPKADAVKNRSLAQLDEKDHCSVEDISEIENKQKDIKIKSQFSSGLASPEKPINYAEEGTPGYFSRVSSLESLNSIPPGSGDNKKIDLCQPIDEMSQDEARKPQTALTEGKVVKFERVVNYAEETPLMFSRSSSLASLDSIEQHSIHDDRESVISDFSRLTSGLVSPSELPDSPTQTVPPSPRQPSSRSFAVRSYRRSPADGESPPEPSNVQKRSVFEDNVTKFKEESTPIQFSTATSLSSLTIDEEPTDLAVKAKEKSEIACISEQEEIEKLNVTDNGDDAQTMSESEGEDDILAACINDGMLKNRLHEKVPHPPSTSEPHKFTIKNLKQTVETVANADIHLDSIHNYCTEDTPALLSHAGSNSNLSLLTTASNLKKEEKNYLSDDSSNLSGDNDNILEECIQAAMPKAKILRKPDVRPRQESGLPIRNVQPVKAENIVKRNIGQPLSMYYGARDELETYAVENSPCHISFHSSLSDLTIDDSTTGKLRMSNTSTPSKNSKLTERFDPTAGSSLLPTEQRDERVRRDSFSSISGDSVGSLENEQGLLEQCISVGMPKNKRSPIPIKQLNLHKTSEVMWEQKRNVETKLTNSKNVNVTSVAKNTAMKNQIQPIQVAGVESLENEESNWNHNLIRTDTSIELTKNGSDEVNISNPKNTSFEDTSAADENENELENGNRESETTRKTFDNRMLDPDAMIESLDRFTAELVSQAEAAHSNKDCKIFSSSITEGDTWNDTSPNDITFPSISGSAPNVITFKSDTDSGDNDHLNNGLINFDVIDGTNDQNSNDFSSLNTSTMTESTLIAVEATKMVSVFRNEIDLSNSLTSTHSLELDQVQPPSQMNSMTCSMTGLEFQPKSSPKLLSRKKSLQSGLLARRAVSNSLNQTSSMESLSNLDYINPPSAMADVFDVDLESSITSLTSLKSEIVDYTDRNQQPNPIFNVKQPVNILHLFSNNSYTDLENINPPSIFNEISDMCNSLADVKTEGICSETECFEDCNTHFADDTVVPTEDDITQFSDAQSITPILSDLSSAETSPKKVKSLSKRLTPKQRRKLHQERYRTYTVAAEMVVSVQNSLAEDDFKSVNSFTESVAASKSVYMDAKGSASPKSSPKERRKNDKARYQTQVLDESVTSALLLLANNNKKEVQSETVPEPTVEKTTSQLKTPRSKLGIRRNFMQKRLENKDRFKTQTISESSLSPDLSSNLPSLTNNEHDLQNLVEKEAGRVLKKLNESKPHPDELLDCETLSLVSNDDDSEHNSGSSINNYRTYTKNSRSKIPPPETIRTKLPSVETKAVNNVEENVSIEAVNSVEEHVSTDESLNCAKPKIVKPEERASIEFNNSENKGIRGRRKPLYSKSNVPARSIPSRPIRNITSNLVKNVTSAIKSNTGLKNQMKPAVGKAPVQNKFIRPPSGQKTSKTSVAVTKTATESPKEKAETTKPPPLERQGTFTKEEQAAAAASKSRIPTSNIPAPKSRIARAISQTNSTVGKTVSKVQSAMSLRSTKLIKSNSSDRAGNSKTNGTFSRSSSADSRDSIKRINSSTSSQSLKNETKSGTTSKLSSLSNISQRSNSNSSLISNGSTSKKQVTSKIASLWKKVEEQKKLPTKKDTRVWIQKEKEVVVPDSPRLKRSDTFDKKNGVALRSKSVSGNCSIKRISRSGSFIVTDDSGNGMNECSSQEQIIDADDDLAF